MRSIRGLVALASLAMSAGCLTDGLSREDGCGDCPSGTVCFDVSCAQVCVATLDCQPGYVCAQGACLTGEDLNNVPCTSPSECPSGVCDGTRCINRRTEPCLDVSPASSTTIMGDVTTEYVAAVGWSLPADCEFTCNAGYDRIGEECLDRQMVPCTDNAPDNATSVPLLVPIAFSQGTGWSQPADCAWNCNLNYFEELGACINQRLEPCNDVAPANATSASQLVVLTYTTASGWTMPSDCLWSCDTDYVDDSGTCINMRTLPCTDNPPLNGTSIPGNVIVNYTTAGGWEIPADCNFTCDTDYWPSAGMCINQQSVPCSDNTPPNATSTPGNVTIIYTTAGGWTTPADCAWTCDPTYCDDNGTCIVEFQEITYDSGTIGGRWFGGDARTPGSPRDVGAGVSINVPSPGFTLGRFGFYFASGFRCSGNPCGAPDVTLLLEHRGPTGNVINTHAVFVPGTFTGGWIYWDIGGYFLTSSTTYIFTAHLQDALTGDQPNASFRGDTAAGNPSSTAYTAQVTSGDITPWANWGGHSWDFFYRLQTPSACN